MIRDLGSVSQKPIMSMWDACRCVIGRTAKSVSQGRMSREQLVTADLLCNLADTNKQTN